LAFGIFYQSISASEVWAFGLGRMTTQGRWGAPDRSSFRLKDQSGTSWKYRKVWKIHFTVVGAKSKLGLYDFLFLKHGKSMPTDRLAF